MAFDKGSLILLDYTARIKDNNEIFETTIEEHAKKSNLYDPVRKYEPRLISLGDGWVLKGLDEALFNTNIGDKLSIEIAPDKGFGERDPNKVRMVPQRKLGEKAAEVQVGDVVELEDHRTGLVRYVGSGRVQIDYNHRLASRTLIYDVNVVKKLETDEDKINSLIRRRLPIIDEQKLKFKLNNKNLEIELSGELLLQEGLQVIKKAISSDIFKFVNLQKITFQEVYLPQATTKDSKPSEKTAATTKDSKPSEKTAATTKDSKPSEKTAATTEGADSK